MILGFRKTAFIMVLLLQCMPRDVFVLSDASTPGAPSLRLRMDNSSKIVHRGTRGHQGNTSDEFEAEHGLDKRAAELEKSSANLSFTNLSFAPVMAEPKPKPTAKPRRNSSTVAGGEHESLGLPLGLLRPNASVSEPISVATVSPSVEKDFRKNESFHSKASGSEKELQVPMIPSKAPISEKGLQDPVLILPEHFERIEAQHTWGVSPFSSQKRLDVLWKDLFDDYDMDEPPVSEGPVAVGVGINVAKIHDLGEVSGTLGLTLSLRLCWEDRRLLFHSAQYFPGSFSHQGDKVPLRSDNIWKPDIVILNAVSGMKNMFAEDHSPLALADQTFAERTGVNILWSRPLKVETKCNIDMSQYPFDVQYCKIRVGSWGTSKRLLRLVPQPFYQDSEVHTAEFKVSNITISMEEIYTHSYAETFTEVHYNLVLTRFPHYYVVNFIIPMVAITLLTIATMWMGVGNLGPRVNSGTKLLLCIVSMMFITARNRPAIHGDIWLDRFQSHCLSLAMSAVLESLFIENITRQFKDAPESSSFLNIFHVFKLNPDLLDSILRAGICCMAGVVIACDLFEVKRFSALALYTTFKAESTRLLVCFVYVIFSGLVVSSIWNICSVWTIYMRKRRHSWQSVPMSIEEPAGVMLESTGSLSTSLDFKKQ